MEHKTKVSADDNAQSIVIQRSFDLPVELLFKAFVEAEYVEQWMGTKVIKLESKKHGSYQFVTTDPMGNKHGFNGTIHELIPNLKITRTFEMEGSDFPVQLEFLEFESTSHEQSVLNMQIVFKSIHDRDNLLKLPFAHGINMAHNRLQNIFNNVK